VSIDKTAPTISGSRSPLANSAGWTNSDVQVGFTCADPLNASNGTIGSGIASCPGTTTLGEGAGQSVTGTATDNAGNTSTAATVDGINVDKSAPTLSGAPTTTANSDGWYNSDVTITWTCADPKLVDGKDGSGIVNCPADNTFTGEGANQSVTRSVSDNAGNSGTGDSAPVNIDKTAPHTVATSPSDWVNSSVTVGLSANDSLSGVKTIHYILDGTATTVAASANPATTDVAISNEGVHTLEFWSVDKAGNAEAHNTATIKIDKTAPTITHGTTQANGKTSPNAQGWNNSDVTVTFTCADTLSGIKSCLADGSSDNTKAVTTEGQNTKVGGTAVDNAGNSQTDNASIGLDKTAPTITGSRSPAANVNGWNNTDVTAGFTCGDALSGVLTCPAATVVSAEGANQTVSGTVTDNAGNTADATVGSISVDKTPPTLTGAITTAASGTDVDGITKWYNTDVTVAWTCADPLSGIPAGTCPADSTVAGEGTNMSASASVKDAADNATNTTVNNIHIDRSAPLTTANAPSGWSNTDVTVALTASDGLSGVKATNFTLDGTPGTGASVPISTEGTHTLVYWSVDYAGNEEAHHTVTVQIDKTPPTITHDQVPAANGNGWNNGDVKVTFTCADQANLSGVQSCTPPQTLTTEGKNQTVTGTAIDNANNTAFDNANVSIDKTKPTITGGADRAPNTFHWYDTDVKVSFTCSDVLSGIATCSNPTTLGEGATQAVTGTAKDAADNSDTFTVSDINVDKTPPSLTGAPDRAANANGWYKSNVLIHWTPGDVLSGIDPATAPGDSTISSEGTGLTASASVQDKAGNGTNATSDSIKLDKTAPTISSALNTTANSAGWFNSPVTVTFTCGDGLSGVANCSSPATLGEGRNLSATGNVSDKADNTNSLTVNGLNIDATAPTLSGKATTDANGNGWYKGDVTIVWACADPKLADGTDGSGVVACPANQTITGEGDSLSLPNSISDVAGNTTNAGSAPVKIDRTAPTTDASAPSAWTNNDVTVTLTPFDGLSGVESTHYKLDGGADQTGTSLTIGTEGSHTLEYWSVDKAGNEETHHTATINIDKTNPTITHTQNPVVNGNGWNNTDVTVTFTCADAPSSGTNASSGIASCTAPQTTTAEGKEQPVTGTAKDNAGNTATDPAKVSIDKTKPVITGAADRKANANGWYNADVTVSFLCTDLLSGIDTCSKPSTLAEGASQAVSGTAVDNAGNTTTATVDKINVDKTDPTIGHTQSPAANGAHWNNSDVTVTFNCGDALSGIDTAANGCTTPQTVSTEAQGQKVTGTALDKAGNTASDTATVNLDKTKPTIGGTASGTPNARNWYNSDVTVTFACGDSLSGVATCSAPTSLGEGANQSASGTATDNAGNSDSATVSGINVDKTAPLLSGQADAANGAGWHNGDVTVTWTCSDALSGIYDCPAKSTVSGEGDNLSATTTDTDNADNTTTSTVSGIKIDRHAPKTTAAAGAGWANTDVTVTLTPTDNLSGVKATYYSVDGAAQQSGTSFAITSEGVHTVTYWSVDNADNTEVKQTVQVLIDKSKPALSGAPTSAPNANGWYNASVTVHFTCSDPKLADGNDGSGMATPCPFDIVVPGDGASQSATGSATDNAGNTTTLKVGGLKIDTTAPVISAISVASTKPFVLGAAPAPTCQATDALSGVDANGCKVTVTGGQANGVGTFTYTAKATDLAGNTKTVTGTYQVIYNVPTNQPFFEQPVNDTAHQVGLATSIFKAGQTVPMKFQLTNAAGQAVQANSAPIWLTPVKGSSTAAGVNESAYGATGDSGSTYTFNGGHYQYNWATSSSQAGYYWKVGVKLDDGQIYTVNIGLR
jgi:large repetitive protein